MTSIDFTGTGITPGATVIYPTRRKSDMHLSQGIVLDVAHGGYEQDATLKVEVRTDKGERRVVYVPAKRCVVQSDTEVRNALRVTASVLRQVKNDEATDGFTRVATIQSLNEALAEAEKLGVVV